MARVIVDEDLCIGSGECIAEDPEVMELDEHGCARVLVANIEDDRAQRICDACPVGALTVSR